MLKRTVLFFTLVSLTLIISGCGGYYAGRLPSNYVEDYVDAVNLNSVSVAVKFFDYDEANEIFSCDMRGRGIQPVFIVIDNKSDVAYGFRKANVEASYVYAEEAAKKCARNQLVYAGPWPPLHVRIIKINDNIRKDYLAKEIVDVSVEPNSDISGVMFIHPLESGEKFRIPLINRKDGSRLVFEFQNP
ncbi:MAG: hypothetical protein P9M07_05780 [Candidatus Aceula meridiana]|nr:hypothetical protein [Candidatus Aceula meridiana]